MTSRSLEQKYQQSLADVAALRAANALLQRQLDWFKRQLFGSTSERLLHVDPAVQQSLLSSMEGLPAPPPSEPEGGTALADPPGPAGHALKSQVLAMDETPIKAGRKAKGKMKEAWFWPLYGDHDEISFTFSPSRAMAHIDQVLGEHFEGVLLTDGNASYARYAGKRPGVTDAECWAHTRRHFEKARGSDEAVDDSLLRIAGIYEIEAWIREKGREGPEKLKARTDYSEPRVRAFWHWCDHQLHRDDLEPQHPLRKAVEHALKRQRSLEVFLSDPEVPIDTNHLERGYAAFPLAQLAVLLERDRRRARGYPAEPADHLPAAGRGSLHVWRAFILPRMP